MADNKNAYEIRADLLHLAYDIVQNNAHMAYEASRTTIQTGGVSSTTTTWTPFTADDVIESAKKLNDFVKQS